MPFNATSAYDTSHFYRHWGTPRKRAVQHFFYRHPFDRCHLRVAVAEDKIHAMPGFIEYQLDDAERQRHIVQQAALFQQAHAHRAGLCVRQPDLCTQAAVVAQAALASLKGAAVRHGVDPHRC